jgi:predicted DNA-binding transcriptional regulator AlpA
MTEETLATAGEAAECDYVLSTTKAAERIGVSTKTLRRMRDRGEAPPRVRLTDRIYGYRNSDIQKFLESRTVA